MDESVYRIINTNNNNINNMEMSEHNLLGSGSEIICRIKTTELTVVVFITFVRKHFVIHVTGNRISDSTCFILAPNVSEHSIMPQID